MTNNFDKYSFIYLKWFVIPCVFTTYLDNRICKGVEDATKWFKMAHPKYYVWILTVAG